MIKSRKLLTTIVLFLSLLLSCLCAFLFIKPQKVGAYTSGSWAQIQGNMYGVLGCNSQSLYEKIKSYTFTNQYPYNGVDFINRHDTSIMSEPIVLDTTSNVEGAQVKVYLVKNGTMTRNKLSPTDASDMSTYYNEDGTFCMAETTIDAYDCYIYADVEKIYLIDLGELFNYSVDLGTYYSQNVENIIFDECIDTSEAKSFARSFKYMQYLKTIKGLENFKTSDATNMSEMFYGTHSLVVSRDVFKNWDTSSVTDMSSMFAMSNVPNCADLSYFNMSSVKNVAKMFDGDDLRTIGSFYDYSGKEYTDKDEFNKQVEEYRELFSSDVKINSLEETMLYLHTALDFDGFTNYFGFDCRINASNINLNLENAKNITDMSGMFSNCYNLKNIDLSGVDASNVTNSVGMFYNCDSLSQIKTPQNMPSDATLSSLGLKGDKFAIEGGDVFLSASDALPAGVTLVTTLSTPSTGVSANIAMVTIALASLLSLIIISAKKKRLAR